jgi:hypothetical protein
MLEYHVALNFRVAFSQKQMKDRSHLAVFRLLGLQKLFDSVVSCNQYTPQEDPEAALEWPLARWAPL